MTEMEVEEGILEDEDDGTNASSEDDNSDDDDDDSSDSSSDEDDDDDEFDDTVIRIPIQDSDEFVVFSTDELPDDEADVVELLRVCRDVHACPFQSKWCFALLILSSWLLSLKIVHCNLLLNAICTTLDKALKYPIAMLIQGEVAPLKIWNKVSLAYYRAHKQDKFAKILNEICDNNDEDDAGETIPGNAHIWTGAQKKNKIK